MNLKNTGIKTLNLVLTGLLAIFGFSNCEPRVEYGTPNADYTLKGKAVNKENLQPIKGIRIGYRPYQGFASMYGVLPVSYTPMAADTTNENGSFRLTHNFSAGTMRTDSIVFYVQDIDGAENGLYRDTTINVNFEDATLAGKKNDWYEGEYTIEKEIQLTPKKEGNE